jgi:hypothetical protein
MRLIIVCAICVTLAGSWLASAQSPNNQGVSTQAVPLSKPVFTGALLVSDDTLLCTLALPGNRRAFASVRLSPEREIVASELENKGVVNLFVEGEQWGTLWNEADIVPGSNADFVLLDPGPVDEPYNVGRRSGAGYTWAQVWLPFPGVNVPTPMPDYQHTVDVARIYLDRGVLLTTCTEGADGPVSYALHNTKDFAVTQSMRVEGYDAESWITVSASPIMELDGPTVAMLEVETPGKQYRLRFLSLAPLADRGSVQIFQPIDMRNPAVANLLVPGTVMVIAARPAEGRVQWVRQRVLLDEKGPRVEETIFIAGLPGQLPQARATNDTYLWFQGESADEIIVHNIAKRSRSMRHLAPGLPAEEHPLALSAAPSGRRFAHWQQGGTLLHVSSMFGNEDPIGLTAETVTWDLR